MKTIRIISSSTGISVYIKNGNIGFFLDFDDWNTCLFVLDYELARANRISIQS